MRPAEIFSAARGSFQTLSSSDLVNSERTVTFVKHHTVNKMRVYYIGKRCIFEVLQ